MSLIDFDKLPAVDELSNYEGIIYNMDMDDVLRNIHEARNRTLNNPDFVPSESEVRVGIMLVRRLRSMRETKTRTTKAAKAEKPTVSLSDLL